VIQNVLNPPIPRSLSDPGGVCAIIPCGPTMLARIGIMQALNRHVERVCNPDRKDPHWGRRKLARERWRSA
jgi:hypothetical protein